MPKNDAQQIATGSRAFDLGAILVDLLYNGIGVSELAKIHKTTVRKMEDIINGKQFQAMYKSESSKRLQYMAHIPIANMATRLQRREMLYEIADTDADPEMCRKLLNDARDEMSALDRSTENVASQQTNGVTINIQEFNAARDPAPIIPNAGINNATSIEVEITEVEDEQNKEELHE